MPCKELLDETEPAGWFGMAVGERYGSRQLTRFMDGLLILKPDSTPARRFQVFKLAMDGKLKQLTKGLKEVVRIETIYDTQIVVMTTGPDDPASRTVGSIDIGTSVEEYSYMDDEQYQDGMRLRNSDFPRNSDNPLMKQSLTNMDMGDPKRQPCQYSEVSCPNIQVTAKARVIIPSKMEVSTARMSYDFKMSSDYNHGVLKL